MPDEMFFSKDERALVRGRRTAKRTATMRPCLLTLPDGRQVEGIILNLTPHGFLIRVLGGLEIGTRIEVQMMRDENFQKPLAEPRFGVVVRLDGSDGSFSDLGIKLEEKPAGPAPRRRAEPTVRRAPEAPEPRRMSGMQTIEVTRGDTKLPGGR